MKTAVLTIGIFLILCSAKVSPQDGFKKDQLRYSRVRTAFAEKGAIITSNLSKLGVQQKGLELYLRAFKLEKKLEVWVRSTSGRFKLYKTFNFCSSSGTLGPKRREGDGQIPEGLYEIEIFNPVSNFFLSMSVSYPNASDVARKTASASGGDIYIHGNCVTIGCIPITDDGIKELYALCVLAKEANKSKIRVDMFPYKMTEKANSAHAKKHPKHASLWKELKPFYTHFETHKTPLNFTIAAGGKYVRR